MAVSPVEY